MKVNLPLFIQVSKNKKFYINLNQYRNTHFQVLNKAKSLFKEIVRLDILKLPKYDKVNINYTLYPKTRKECDVANVCSIADKFFSDALVEYGKLEDDNYNYVKKVSYMFGSIDPDNPRIEVNIEEVDMKRKILVTLDTDDIRQALTEYVQREMNMNENERVEFGSLPTELDGVVETIEKPVETKSDSSSSKDTLLGSKPEKKSKPIPVARTVEEPSEDATEAQEEDPTETVAEDSVEPVEPTVAVDAANTTNLGGKVAEPEKPAHKSIFANFGKK